MNLIKTKKVKYNLDNLFDYDPFPDFLVEDIFEKRMKKATHVKQEIDDINTSINERYKYNSLIRHGLGVSSKKI